MAEKIPVDPNTIKAMVEEARQFADEFQSWTEPPRPWKVKEINVSPLSNVGSEEMLRQLKEATLARIGVAMSPAQAEEMVYVVIPRGKPTLPQPGIPEDAPHHPAFLATLATLLRLDEHAARDWLIAKIGAYRCISDNEAEALIDEVLG